MYYLQKVKTELDEEDIKIEKCEAKPVAASRMVFHMLFLYLSKLMSVCHK